jgi:uncharacterized membrane protein
VGEDAAYNKNMKISKWLLIAFVIFGLIGFTDATYLATRYYRGLNIGCPVASLSNYSFFEKCDRVTASQYATIGNIPVSLFGSIYYFIVLVFMAVYFWQEKEKIIDWLARFTVVGFLASLWFIYLQLFVIKAICFYCMVSAAASTILFILGLLIIQKGRK